MNGVEGFDYLPANMQAEQALLGALLANNRAYERVGEFLREHHFADPLHGRIYKVIAELVDAGRVADPITLRARFEGDADLEQTGGVGYLAQLLSAMVGIINAGDYGKLIVDCWLRREIIAVTENIYNRSFGGNGGEEAAVLMEELEARLSRIADGAGDISPVVSAGEGVAQALEMTQEASRRESGIAGVTSGYAAIDRMLSGLQKQKFVLIGARPSMGKTGLGLGIAARAAADGTPTLFWSGEMGPEQLGARMAAAHAQLDTLSVFSGRKYEPHPDSDPSRAELLSPHDWDRLVKSEREARKLPLWFDCRPGLTVQALRARARRMKRTHKLGLVVVDYIGLMRASQQTEQRPLYERVTEISKSLKTLAMELDIPLVVCSQVNRNNEARDAKLPQMSDLRDSGSLEQDADVIMFIHRPHYYLVRQGDPVRRDKESVDEFEDRRERYHRELDATKGLAQISVAKNRQGPTGMTRVRFQDRTTWFFDERDGDVGPAWQSGLLGGQ